MDLRHILLLYACVLLDLPALAQEENLPAARALCEEILSQRSQLSRTYRIFELETTTAFNKIKQNEEHYRQPLMELVSQPDIPPAVRLEAVRVLHHLTPFPLIPEAFKIMMDPAQSLELRRELILLMSFFKEAQAVPYLVKLVQEKGPLATAVMQTLELLVEDEAAIEPLLVFFNDPDPALRVSVATLCGRVQGSASLAYLHKATADPYPAVRAAALSALAQRQEQESLPMIQKALQDPAGQVRSAAVLAFSFYPEHADLPALLAIWQQALQSLDHRQKEAEKAQQMEQEQLKRCRQSIKREERRQNQRAWEVAVAEKDRLARALPDHLALLEAICLTLPQVNDKDPNVLTALTTAVGMQDTRLSHAALSGLQNMDGEWLKQTHIKLLVQTLYPGLTERWPPMASLWQDASTFLATLLDLPSQNTPADWLNWGKGDGATFLQK